MSYPVRRFSGWPEKDHEPIHRKLEKPMIQPHASLSMGSVVYDDGYNIGVPGMQHAHPFDAQKWGNVYRRLLEGGILYPEAVVHPHEATNEQLGRVHTKAYLQSLKSSVNVARIIEVHAAAVLPPGLVDAYLLHPMRLQTGGTVRAAELAVQHRGSAINIGGGFHHASDDRGGGFCVYADITLALRELLDSGRIKSALIVDLDAHQGNGHERDFAGDGRVKILDMYNSEIYPQDMEARKSIDYDIKLLSGASDEEYLYHLKHGLKEALADPHNLPDLLFYNAGTDCLANDRLGFLNVSREGIIVRDEMVFTAARKHSIPIVMVTSGGYTKQSAGVIADSIENLVAKGLVA